eukprot:Nk52_evm10s675 gene=Nk52_evmTU10s675
MEVLKERASLLSNYEVYNILKEKLVQPEDKKNTKNASPKSVKAAKREELYIQRTQQNLLTISYEVCQHLKDVSPFIPELKEEDVEGMLNELRQYALTKSEKLSILNRMPQSTVEMYSLVEECEERFTEEEIDKILELVQNYYVAGDQEQQGEEEGDEENQMETDS